MKRSGGILTAVFLLGASAAAAEPIGTLVFHEGICDVTRGVQTPEAVSGATPIYLNDRIRTKSYSKARIEFADKSVLKLAPNSSISIQEFRMAGGRREFARVLLTRGKLEAVVSKTGAPDTFAIDTPNAKGSVKGSDIFVSYLAGRTGVFVQEGAMSVASLTSAAGAVKVTKGDCVFVPFEEAPGEIRAAMDLELANHKKDVEGSLIKKWVPSRDSERMNAVVVSSAGDVRLFRHNAQDWTALKTQDTLSEGDKIQTGEDGRAEIRLSNGNSMFLEPGSELSFTTLRIDTATGDYENTFLLPRGKLNSIVEKIGKRSTFKVSTPTAVATVRGTYLQVIAELPRPDAPLPQTLVFFEGGSGDVTSLLTNDIQPMQSGENVSVDPGGNIAPPLQTTPEQRVGIAQTWAMAQNVGQYAGTQMGTGFNTASPQGLPPPPPPPGPGGQQGLPPLAQQTQNLQLLSSLTFDQVVGPPPPPPPGFLYTTAMPRMAGPPAAITSGNAGVGLKFDHTWGGMLNGTFNTAVPTSWNFNVQNPVTLDELHFTLGPLAMNTPNGTLSVTLDPAFDTLTGPPVDKELTLNSGLQGTYTSGSTSGTFQVPVNGTWIDV